MERGWIIYNPAARNAPSRERLLAAAQAAGAGWRFEVVATQASGHGVELAREAVAGGASVVFACGGDGTINEVVNGLAGTPAALGVLRGGMGNVFAKEIGVPRAPEQALPRLLAGRRQRYDLGVVNERYFLLMAGVGFDAEVVKRVPSGAKRRLGSTAYALWALKTLPGYRARRVSLQVDGEARESDLYWLLLGNTRSYGGIIDITSKAEIDDGLLDGYVFAGRGLGWAAATALRLLARRQDGGRGVTFQRVKELSVETPGLAVQVDGEYVGETPVRFGVAPGAIEVLLPG